MGRIADDPNAELRATTTGIARASEDIPALHDQLMQIHGLACCLGPGD
jgi:hypothetical protein